MTDTNTKTNHFSGLELGQDQDYPALAVLEKAVTRHDYPGQPAIPNT